MFQNSNTAIAIVGIDIGKNSFHLVALDHRAAQSRCVSSSRVAVFTAAMHTTLPTWVIRCMADHCRGAFFIRCAPNRWDNRPAVCG